MILAMILFAVLPDGNGILLKSPILYAFITSLPVLVYVPVVSMYVSIVASSIQSIFNTIRLSPFAKCFFDFSCTASKLWFISVSVSSKKD